MRIEAFAIGTGLLLLPVALVAQTATPGAPSNAQGDVSVTIYNNLALVQDVRQMSLPGGRSRQEFQTFRRRSGLRRSYLVAKVSGSLSKTSITICSPPAR